MPRVLTLGWHVIAPGRGILVNSEVAHKKWLVQKGRAEPTVAYHPRSWRRVDQPCFLLGGYTNYYHHLVDYVFNLYCAERSPHAKSLPFLVLQMQHSFQREIAAHLGFRPDQLIEVPPLSAVRCRALSVIPRSFRNSVPPWSRGSSTGSGTVSSAGNRGARSDGSTYRDARLHGEGRATKRTSWPS